MKLKVPKECKNCNKSYRGFKSSSYCSLLCANQDNKTKFKKGSIPWNVGIPRSEETKKKLSVANKGRILSDEWKRKIGLNGFHYGMLGKKHSLKTRTLMSEAHKGNKSWSWQGGITKLSAQIRNSFKYRQWRSDVFTRDNYTCQKCEQVGGKLNVDHITPFSVIFAKNCISSFDEAMECEEFWNINNGSTLCLACHKKTDTFLSGALKYKNAVIVSHSVI